MIYAYELALFDSIKNCDHHMMKHALARGAPVDSRDKFQCTPLMSACYHGHLEMARSLIDSGADINARCDIRATPVIYAAWGGHLEVLKLLETRGANVQIRDDLENSVLHYGAGTGHLEVVEFLLHLGLPVNQFNLIGRTPLLDAINANTNAEMIGLLLATGADPNLTDAIVQLSPLKAALAMGRSDITKMLIDAGAI